MTEENVLYAQIVLDELSRGNFAAVALVILSGVTALVTVACCVVLICLKGSYTRNLREPNEAGLTGLDVATRIITERLVSRAKVTTTLSFLLGNSYSYLFRRIRLRYGIYWRNSVASLALGGQKAMLAEMQNEEDPDMKGRVWLSLLKSFGPVAFCPLVIVGLLFDLVFYSGNGIMPMVCAGLGLLFYFLAALAAQFTLNSEKKGQERAYDLFARQGLATEEEIEKMRKMFFLYNLVEVANTIFAILKFVTYLLQICVIAMA